MIEIIKQMLPIVKKVAIFAAIALAGYILFVKIKDIGYKAGIADCDRRVARLTADFEKKLADKDTTIIRLASQPKTQINVKKIKDNGKLTN